MQTDLNRIALPGLEANAVPSVSPLQGFILAHIGTFVLVWWILYAAVAATVIVRLGLLWYRSYFDRHSK